MGGYGSGRHMRARRATVDQSRSISAGELPRLGLITPGRPQSSTIEWSGEGLWPLGSRGTLTVCARDTRRATARLTYRAGGAAHPLDEEITLHSTAQPLGGRRWWFQCPACGRRCGKLHLPPAALRFRCRLCHGLAYQSQRESPPARWERRAEKIMERLGGEAEDGLVYKP